MLRRNSQEDASFPNRVIYFDKHEFDVDGKRKKHNFMIQKTENSQEKKEVVRDEKKVIVWCAMSVNRVIDAFYSDSRNATSESHMQVLTSCFLPTLPSLP